MSDRIYQFKLAQTDAEIAAYFELRQQIFCQEQGLFTQDDRDPIDAIAYPIVALVEAPDQAARVVGVVRIYEEAPGLWYGGRLGVCPDYRRVGRIGKGLIQTAVTTANSWGCDRFLATVQRQNVRFFQRLHWRSLEEIDLCGRPHHRMLADLAHYPAAPAPRPERDRPAAVRVA